MKRRPELRDLSEDHHTGLVLARRCKQAGEEKPGCQPQAVWTQALEAFSTHLEPHFRIEEEHLLPALVSIGEASLAERIRDDHRALRELRDTQDVTPATVSRFGRLLESHIRFEERQVFETVQDRLPKAVLDAVEAACRAIPRSCLLASAS